MHLALVVGFLSVASAQDSTKQRVDEIEAALAKSIEKLNYQNSYVLQIQQSVVELARKYIYEANTNTKNQYKSQIKTKQGEYCLQAESALNEMRRQYAYTVEMYTLALPGIRDECIAKFDGNATMFQKTLRDAQSQSSNAQPYEDLAARLATTQANCSEMVDNVKSTMASNKEGCSMSFEEIVAIASEPDPILVLQQEPDEMAEDIVVRSATIDEYLAKMNDGLTTEERDRIESDIDAETKLMCGDLKGLLSMTKSYTVQQLGVDIETDPEFANKMVGAYNTKSELDAKFEESKMIEETLLKLLYAANTTNTTGSADYGRTRGDIMAYRSEIRQCCDKPKAEMLDALKKKAAAAQAENGGAMISHLSMIAGILGLIVGCLANYCYGSF